MLYFLRACTQNCKKAHSREYAQLILTTLRAVVLLIRRTHVVTFWCAFGALLVRFLLRITLVYTGSLLRIALRTSYGQLLHLVGKASR